MTARARRTVERIVAAAALLAMIGCSGGREPSGPAEKAFAVDRIVEKGPVRVRVRLAAETITIADTDELRLDLEGPPDCRFEVPRVDELAIEPFTAKDVVVDRPRLEGDRMIASMRVELEPFLSGDYPVGPFKVRFTLEGEPPGDDGAPVVHELRVDEMKVRVDSIAGDVSAGLELRPLRDPATLAGRRKGSPAAWIAAAAGGLAAAGLGIAAARRLLRARARSAPPVPPREVALAALRRLRDRKLLEAGRVREFYYEICLILRTFIGEEFGIRAAEETTEEFLRDLTGEARFSEETKGLLERFLTHCDLVRYARYAPADEEIQGTIDVTRDFIERSAAATEGVPHGV